MQTLRLTFFPYIAVASNLAGGTIFAVVTFNILPDSAPRIHTIGFPIATVLWFVAALLMPRAVWEYDRVRQSLRFNRGPWIMPPLFSTEIPIDAIDMLVVEKYCSTSRKGPRHYWRAYAKLKDGEQKRISAALMMPNTMKRTCQRLAVALGVACVCVELNRDGLPTNSDVLFLPHTSDDSRT